LPTTGGAEFELDALGTEGVGDPSVGSVGLAVDAVGSHNGHRRVPQVIRAAAQRSAAMRLSQGASTNHRRRLDGHEDGQGSR
jgi:hypothetical protein